MMRIAIFASGRGSNARAIYEASGKPSPSFEVVAIFSDNEKSDVLQFAKDNGIPTFCKDGKKTEIENHFLKSLDEIQPDLICLAGYMKILSAAFVNKWAGKIINIHPSLLPKYKGLDTHARAIAEGDSEHGATVHYVTTELDDGKIIAQTSIPILPSDTAETLAKRLLPEEHKLYISALQKLASML